MDSHSISPKKKLSFTRFIIGMLIGMPIEYFFLQPFLVSSIFKKRANECKNINDIVKLSYEMFRRFPFNAQRAPYPFNYAGWTTRPSQVKEELTNLLRIIQRRQPERILEIGTAAGGSFFAFTKSSNPNAVIISVELLFSNSCCGYPVWKIPFYKSFKTRQQKIFLLRKDSHALSTLSAVKKILGVQKLDFLFIDGDHTYDGVKKDFEMYSPLVHQGGLIAFHDICRHTVGFSEVNKFWSEVKDRYNHTEIVENPKQGWAGIGVLFV